MVPVASVGAMAGGLVVGGSPELLLSWLEWTLVEVSVGCFILSVAG